MDKENKADPRKVKALYDFEAENEGDLSFKEGDIIQVQDCKDPSGWWNGILGGRSGVFPSNFVEIIE